MPVPEWLADVGQWQQYVDRARLREPWSAYPDEFYARLIRMSKRARLVAWRIFEDGQTDTQQLLESYDYTHAPRAARDIRDVGIRLESGRGRHTVSGRPLAVYSFAAPGTVLTAENKGRAALPQSFIETVFARAEHQCSLCAGHFESRFLQADHCIPYAIAGDDLDGEPDIESFMSVCRSCNRAKSWSCEHCLNWLDQDAKVCASCYWAAPNDYQHIATEPLRRLDLVWRGEETASFDLLRSMTERIGEPLPAFVKQVLGALASQLGDPPV